MLQMRKIIGLLLFIFLMLIKVSALHVYAHQSNDCDTIENCDICDIALENQSSDLEIPSLPILSSSKEIVQVKRFTEKAQVFFRESNTYQLFSRPPPLL
ncbi:hypothetical protein HME9304_03036 [Flagellimonas maritima]|uniref:Uncharacterized protein n=2 Tax=Flagellimonas maritima TaxID=1383885 RepID=A0A2Z4LWV9_9FLAO|nr:hypothetical protein HME9304_03036 [Allomuricauda aurantiaca]